jgi:hypothetical protein
VSDWSQLLDEVAELEVPATLRGRVFAGAQAGPPPPPHRRVRRAVLIAAAAVGIAFVVTALVVAAHSRRDRPAPAKSEPGLSTMADAAHRAAVAYRDFAQTTCAKRGPTEADVPACLAAASELRRQIQALRREAIAIGDAGSAACKKSADGYDVGLRSVEWALMTLPRAVPINRLGLWVGIVSSRVSTGWGPIDACLPTPARSEPGPLADAEHRVAVAYRDFVEAPSDCAKKKATTGAGLPACPAAALELRRQIEALRQVVFAVGNAGSLACKLSAHAYDFDLQMLRHALVDGHYFGVRVVGQRYLTIAVPGGIIDECL